MRDSQERSHFPPQRVEITAMSTVDPTLRDDPLQSEARCFQQVVYSAPSYGMHILRACVLHGALSHHVMSRGSVDDVQLDLGCVISYVTVS